jgi:hypothetical protein
LFRTSIEFLLTAIVTGTAVGVAVYIGTNLYFGTPITAGGIIGAFVMGAISGAVSFGIGEAVSSIAQFGVRITVQALAHGVFQGGLSYVQSGNFASGFISGALSSIACSAWGGGKLANGDGEWGGIGGNFAKGGAGTLFFGALAGGVGASLGGGNFWQGAVTGLFVAGMNHLAHMTDNAYEDNKLDKDIDDHYGVTKADTSAPPTEKSVEEIMQISSLKRWGEYKFKLVVDKDHMFRPNDRKEAVAITELAPDNRSSIVTLYKSSFSSFRTLAHNMMHEMGHVIFNRLGFMELTTKLYGRDTAIYGSERYAYTFAGKYGGNPYESFVDYARGIGYTQGLPLQNFGNGWYIKY